LTKLWLAVIAGLTVVVLAATVNLTGEWEVESNFDDSSLGGGGFDCVFKQDAEQLTGTCSAGEAQLSGEVKGQTVSWKVAVATYTGTVNEAGTHIEGRFQADGKGGSFYASKSK
jgi:hypothetical protein